MKSPGACTAVVWFFGSLLFWCAWIIGLAGLAATQDYCEGHTVVIAQLTQGVSFVAITPGKDCTKLFRFPWTVFWLSSLAGMFGVLSFCSFSRFTRGTGRALCAAMVPLNVLMANTFYTLSEVPGIPDTADTYAKTALSGFAIMAAAQLLMITCDAMLTQAEEKQADESKSGAEHASDAQVIQMPPGSSGTTYQALTADACTCVLRILAG
eukprot:TRINITY_DN1749_c0_g1_i4.p1 TRINITY_DN1749_c0_g1~~TRINITY_DN1749_c0_g1_i4.p1  ORF type:complete len:210 (-),score=14.25 TRINITY_DN1749_c0_g1_i4:432-1061(-)